MPVIIVKKLSPEEQAKADEKMAWVALLGFGSLLVYAFTRKK